jgi:hypothetical protein
MPQYSISTSIVARSSVVPGEGCQSGPAAFKSSGARLRLDPARALLRGSAMPVAEDL